MTKKTSILVPEFDNMFEMFMSVDDFKARDILAKFAKTIKFNYSNTYDEIGCWYRSNECKYTLCLTKIFKLNNYLGETESEYYEIVDDNKEPIYVLTIYNYREALYNFLKKIKEGKTFAIYDSKHKCGEIDSAALQCLKFECALAGVCL